MKQRGMEMEKVTIIIPVYNVENYLDDCIQSACNQTYSALEIILVDDGSTDGCCTICDSWLKKDPRVTVIHKKNGGLSDARNAGLNAATGKYIYFLDGDDSIKPNLVENCVKYMENDTDMVAFQFGEVLSDGTVQNVDYHERGLYELNDLQERKNFLIQKILRGKIGWEAWSRMYSRELIEKYEIRFADNRVVFAEDLYFCICYCAHVKRVVSIADSLYNYFIRKDSTMRRDGMKLNIGRMNELGKEVLAHFQKWEECKALVDCFPLIHYLIIENVLFRAMMYNKLPFREFGKAIREDITDFSFFKMQMNQLHRYRKELYLLFTVSQAEERINIIRYIINGNYIVLRIRNRMIYMLANVLDRKSLVG